MSQIIKHIWWHIDEFYYPRKCKRYRQIMQLFTNEKILELNFGKKFFFGLKVSGRNSSRREISFVEDGDGSDFTILLNLDLKAFPSVPFQILPEFNYSDVKIEIEYFTWDGLSEVSENLSLFESIRYYFSPRNLNESEIEGKIQPEFSIKLPLGWKLDESYKPDVVLVISGFNSVMNDYFSETLPLEVVSIILEGGQRVYNCISLDFDIIKKKYEDSGNQDFMAHLYYQTKISRYFFFISNIPILISLATAMVTIYGVICLLNSEIAFSEKFQAIGTGMGIIILSYVYFYISLMKEGYHFIHSKRDFTLITICLIIWIFVLLEPIWGITTLASSLINDISIFWSNLGIHWYIWYTNSVF